MYQGGIGGGSRLDNVYDIVHGSFKNGSASNAFRHRTELVSSLKLTEIQRILVLLARGFSSPERVPYPIFLNSFIVASFFGSRTRKFRSSYDSFWGVRNVWLGRVQDKRRRDRDEDEDDDDERGDDEGEEHEPGEVFADYRPAKLQAGEPHPDPVVETASLAAVEPPDVTHDLAIQDLVDARMLSGLQLESVVYACQRHALFLPGGSRCGFFIGDGAPSGVFAYHYHARVRATYLRGSACRRGCRQGTDDSRPNRGELAAGTAATPLDLGRRGPARRRATRYERHRR